MKTFLSFIATVLFTALIVGAGVFIWGMMELRKPGPLTQDTVVLIEKGSSGAKIADTLAQAGIIENPLIFRGAALLTGTQKKLQAGEYEFQAGISAREAMTLLASGKTFQHQITIPEGLSSAEIVALLNAEPSLSGTIEAIPEEGTLLPETYNFSYGDDRAQKIAQMQDAMHNLLTELWNIHDPTLLLLTPKDAVTLASIVEKETGVASERARVAGVFYNRMREGMALQSDPTVVYALTKGLSPLGRSLTRMDIDGTDSPYNTYKNTGLPPGPIANPGRASLEAIFLPEDHHYLYFVADGTGGHVFSETLEEHNKNVAKWREIQKTPPAAEPPAATEPVAPAEPAPAAPAP